MLSNKTYLIVFELLEKCNNTFKSHIFHQGIRENLRDIKFSNNLYASV